MQPVWFCILTGKPFEDTFDNTQWRKVKSMQTMPLCLDRRLLCCDQSALRRHLKTHIGEKTNKCSQCQFASREAGNLRRHLHSGEKTHINSIVHFVVYNIELTSREPPHTHTTTVVVPPIHTQTHILYPDPNTSGSSKI